MGMQSSSGYTNMYVVKWKNMLLSDIINIFHLCSILI